MNYETLLGVWHFCMAYHGGQSSREYRIFCKIGRIMTPARSEEYASVLARPDYAAAREVYVALASKVDGETSYIACVCCGVDMMGTRAEAGVTMCEECCEADCDPNGGCSCEEEHEGPIELSKEMAEQGFTAGKLPSFTSVGCYPLFYVVKSGRKEQAWCADCCNSDHNSEADEDARVVATDANWEDADLTCECCEERIESAYAEESEDGQ